MRAPACNVVLREHGPETIVEVMGPLVVLGTVEEPPTKPIAAEARAHLTRATVALQTGSQCLVPAAHDSRADSLPKSDESTARPVAVSGPTTGDWLRLDGGPTIER